MSKRIALFASGSGSNVENFIKFFADKPEVEIVGIFCNNPNAFVFERVKPYGFDVKLFSRDEFSVTGKVIADLQDLQVDLIVLAGFLWLVPASLVHAFPNKIVNIHPALLPEYGGKGMYGMKVHEAVVANKADESGITIHFVNEHYDEGKIIFQGKCPVDPTDTAEDVANKVHALEYEFFPKIVHQILSS